MCCCFLCLRALFVVAAVDFKNGHERLARNFHGAELPHFLFALFLFFEKFFLSRYVAAVALCENVFAQSFNRLSRYDLSADSRLNGYFEKLAGDNVFKSFRLSSASRVGFVFMDDDRKRVANFAV